jgi:cbb3-type cytochrome oxidase maturation protein
MSILPAMVVLSLLVVAGAGLAFFWAVDHDQFEDLDSPAFMPLVGDPPPQEPHGEHEPPGVA